MSQRIYLWMSSMVFAVVSLAHLSRLVMHWPMRIGGWDVPGWISIVGFVVAGLLSIQGFRLNRAASA